MASFPGGYPAARRLDLVEDLHGYVVADPYRWLEDADSPETQAWLAAEEELWAGYRARLPRREAFAAQVRELLRVGVVGGPTWRGTNRLAMRCSTSRIMKQARGARASGC
jgi:prolyl oligopeptidase